jgi:hypothetical protein
MQDRIGLRRGWEEFCTALPGTWPQAKRALDIGFMISFAGNLTFPKAQQIRDAALQVPLERMLIETDSPYLAPVPNRGKRNEPAFVKETARKLGELRGLAMEEIGPRRHTDNFYSFFKLAEIAESKVSAAFTLVLCTSFFWYSLESYSIISERTEIRCPIIVLTS